MAAWSDIPIELIAYMIRVAARSGVRGAIWPLIQLESRIAAYFISVSLHDWIFECDNRGAQRGRVPAEIVHDIPYWTKNALRDHGINIADLMCEMPAREGRLHGVIKITGGTSHAPINVEMRYLAGELILAHMRADHIHVWSRRYHIVCTHNHGIYSTIYEGYARVGRYILARGHDLPTDYRTISPFFALILNIHNERKATLDKIYERLKDCAIVPD